MNYKIAPIILNYNSFSDTIKLVDELQKQTIAQDLYIVIVDNASPDNSFVHLKPLEKKYKNLVVLQTGSNLGYAKGNNYGLQYLDENIHPDYVAILNSDVILPYNCFENLIKRYEVLDKPAIIAPKQLNDKNEELPAYRMNSFLDDCLHLFFIFKIFYKRRVLRLKDNTGQNAMKVEMIPGSFMFASFPVFKSMGFFFPDTFLFVEERFIAMKAKQMGLNNYIILDQSYVHAHSKTINSVYQNLEKYKLLYDGWIKFTLTHRSLGKQKAIILRFLIKLSLLELKIVSTITEIFSKVFNKS